MVEGAGKTLTTIAKLKKTYNKHTTRFIELDLLRGFAIIFMVFLHIIWDLDYFGLVPMNTQIYKLQICVPAMFFVLLGICIHVSGNKKIQKSIYDEKKYYKHLFFRGLKIIGLGIIISLVSMVFLSDRPIFFGVLHCIGVSIILCIPFLKFKIFNLIPASFTIIAGYLFGQYTIDNPTIFHLAIGLHQSNISQHTVDYFPLFPWLGACLIGLALGSILYKDNERRFRLPDLSVYTPVKLFSWLGKHSLIIYLIHQPIIAGVLSIFVIF